MAKEAEKRAARPATKAVRKVTAKKATAKRPSQAKPTAKTAPKSATPKARKPFETPAVPTAEALQSPWLSGLQNWQATAAKAAAAYVETGRVATTTALELGRRNIEFQRDMFAKGLEVSQDIRR